MATVRRAQEPIDDSNHDASDTEDERILRDG
jgi:hypothetical protein